MATNISKFGFDIWHKLPQVKNEVQSRILAQEEALEKETQARQALQEQIREQLDQHREETDRLLRYIYSLIAEEK